jgi:ribonuclease D
MDPHTDGTFDRYQTLRTENHYLKEKVAQLCAELKSFDELEAAATQRQFEIEALLRELALSREREAAAVELMMECVSVDEICAAQRAIAWQALEEWEVFWDLEGSEEEETDAMDDD